MPKMKAIHKIVRRPSGKKDQIITPGATFDCGQTEADDYLRLKAAVVVEAEKKAPTKKAASKPEPEKAAPKPEPEKDDGDSEGGMLD